MLYALILFYTTGAVVNAGVYHDKPTCMAQGKQAGEDADGTPRSYAYRCIPVNG